MLRDWPSLPTTGFVSGRSATESDVQDGNALFVLRSDDRPIGNPIAMTIPQYAYWRNEDGGKQLVVVIQAEEARGQRVVGIRDSQGTTYVALASEIEPLGLQPPREAGSPER